MLKTSLTTIALMLLLVGTAYAGQVSTTLSVTTTVNGTCTVNTSPVAFSGFDGSVPVNAQGSVTVNCTNGQNYWVALEGGQHLGQGTVGVRTLANGTNYLDYELYQPDGTTIWGDGGFNDTYIYPPLVGIGSGTNQVLTVNGVLAAGSPVAGTYTDTVVVYMEF